MEKAVKLKYLHIAPRKVRLLADLIRGKSLEDAENLLNFTVKRGTKDLLGLLKSAAAALSGKEKKDLRVKKIFVDEGPKYKRWMPRARGQAYEIQKKTSHVTVVLEGAETKLVEDKPQPVKLRGSAQEKTKFEKPESEIKKPKTEKSFKRFFRRKAI